VPGILSAVGTLAKQAATPAAGFALQNATPTVISWTAPNDGNIHRVLVFAAMSVTSPLTGGEIDATLTVPDGTTSQPQLFPGNQSGGAKNMSFCVYIVKAGSTFSLVQSSAASAGAGVIWAEIWGS
jgi:hypothetical protein